MITRTIGGILRGKATPFQMILGSILGAMLGYMPGFAQAPGLIVMLAVLILVLNVNIGLVLLVALAAKLIAWLTLPFTFMVGRGLMDGAAPGFFGTLINAPVFALMGFDYYVTTGGVALGLLLGSIIGLLLTQGVQTYRRRMSRLEEGSERYQKFVSKWWVKVLLFIFAGFGHGKKSYAQLLQRKVGNPIRWWGAAIAAVLLVGLVVGRGLLGNALIQSQLKQQLEKMNGATVDIGDFDLNLSEGRLMVRGFAMADPNALDTNLLSAGVVEAQINTSDLLRKRLVIEKLSITEARSGEKRAVPGKRIGKPPQPLPDETPGKTLEEYLAEAQVWKDRLTQLRKWLEELSKPKEQKPETLKERLDRLVREDGYSRIRAEHLVEGSPTLLVRELSAYGVKTDQFKGETLDIVARNLSTNPGLVAEGASIRIDSSGKTLSFLADLAEASASGGQSQLAIAYRGISGSKTDKLLKGNGSKSAIEVGRVDFQAKGTFKGGYIEFPQQPMLLLHDVKLPHGRVDELALMLGLRGALDSPKIQLDPQVFANLARGVIDQQLRDFQDEARKQLEKTFNGKLPIDPGKILDPTKSPDPGKAIDPGKLIDPAKLDPGKLFGTPEKKKETEQPKAPATRPRKRTPQ